MRVLNVTLIILVVALAPLAAATDAPAEAAPTTTTSFSYAPPIGFAGDLSLRFGFDWGQDNTCQILFGMSGLVGDTPLYGMVATDTGASFGFYHDDAFRVRGNGESFNVESTQIGDTWGFGIFQFLTLTGTEAYTIAGSGLKTWTSESGATSQNLFFDVSCNDPFTVLSIAGGNDVVTFTENRGNGFGIGVYTPANEAGAFVLDGAATAFDTPEAALVLRAFIGGGAGLGTAEITTPEGTERITYQDELAVDRHGEGGSYGIALTRADIGASTTFYGALVGLETVGTVEDLTRFTG